MNKKNNWLKFKTDFFASLAMKKMRKIAGGDSYVIIYQKLMLLTVNSEGHYHLEGIENTIEEELSLIIDEDIDNVKITLNILHSLNLIENDNNTLFLPQVPALIGKNDDSSLRVTAYRERKKIQCNALQSLHVTESNDPREREREREREEIDKDIKKEIKYKNETIFNFEGFTKEEKESIEDWIQYKKEIKETYKSIGLKSLRTKLLNLKDKDIDLVSSINNSISSGYKGIFEDKSSNNKEQTFVPNIGNFYCSSKGDKML